MKDINSLIFDYSSINDFYELFNNTEKSHPKYNLSSYYNDVQDYVNSIDFENDTHYWKNYIQNSSNHIKFYNIKHNHYNNQKINQNKDSVFTFIKNHDCTLFDFYGSIFSLYLSLIDRLDGCLLKTLVPKKTDLQIFDKNTLFKVDVNQHESFNDLINKFSSSFKNASNHIKVDVENYLDENTTIIPFMTLMTLKNPNWIADDFDVLENTNEGGTEIINDLLNDFNDFLTEFFVQVYQNGADYRLNISHSNKYSQNMINDFKDTYISILSNIINASMSSDLSSTLK